ncbi:hypothetical protein QWY16_08335 [Planococcus shenhongbingii]|nr:hypothetical protein [Planococcus sp. N016]WKA60102.1 hypothetical protein QWY16_08335 [Planococcus sp. N016]
MNVRQPKAFGEVISVPPSWLTDYTEELGAVNEHGTSCRLKSWPLEPDI